jgi:hypothetical protein
MRRHAGLLALAAGLLLGIGCSKSDDGAGAAAGGSAGRSATSNVGPEAIVADFLEAVRVGNDEQAGLMLSKLAREKTQEMNMVVAPPGSETAQYVVGEVELLPDDIAHVASTWTDEGEDHQIVWALRKEPEGWRIAGMATKIFEGEPPLLLNFEDPEDMVRQQQLAEQEMIRRAQQANQPVNTDGEVDGEDGSPEASLVESDTASSPRQANRPSNRTKQPQETRRE